MDIGKEEHLFTVNGVQKVHMKINKVFSQKAINRDPYDLDILLLGIYPMESIYEHEDTVHYCSTHISHKMRTA